MKSSLSARCVAAVSALGLMLLAGCGGTDAGSDSAAKPGATTSASTMLPKSIQESGVLTIATDAELPPNNFMAEDGKTMQGVSIDIGNALAEALGVKPKFVNTKFAALLTGLQGERFDIAISGLGDTLERQKIVDFVDFLYSGQVFLVPEGNPGNVTSLDTLCGKRASLITGTISVDLANQASKDCVAKGQPAIKIANFPAAADAILQLENGRADANITDMGKAAYQASQSGGKLEVAGDKFAPTYGGVGVRKGDKEMTDSLQWAFGEIMKNGKYQAALKKWGVEQSAMDEVVLNATHA
jgi:polar amino acid transport system substrate-binding protein